MINSGPSILAVAQALTSAFAAPNTIAVLACNGYDKIGVRVSYTSNAAGAGGGYPTIRVRWTFLGAVTVFGLMQQGGILVPEDVALQGPGVVNTTVAQAFALDVLPGASELAIQVKETGDTTNVGTVTISAVLARNA